jgi:hypothetical protein
MSRRPPGRPSQNDNIPWRTHENPKRLGHGHSFADRAPLRIKLNGTDSRHAQKASDLPCICFLSRQVLGRIAAKIPFRGKQKGGFGSLQYLYRSTGRRSGLVQSRDCRAELARRLRARRQPGCRWLCFGTPHREDGRAILGCDKSNNVYIVALGDMSVPEPFARRFRASRRGCKATSRAIAGSLFRAGAHGETNHRPGPSAITCRREWRAA